MILPVFLPSWIEEGAESRGVRLLLAVQAQPVFGPAERRRALLVQAEHEFVRGAGAATWVAASHAELARPMLALAAPPLLAALSSALHWVGDEGQAGALLHCLPQLLGLAGTLGLEDVCKQVRGGDPVSTCPCVCVCVCVCA